MTRASGTAASSAASAAVTSDGTAGTTTGVVTIKSTSTLTNYITVYPVSSQVTYGASTVVNDISTAAAASASASAAGADASGTCGTGSTVTVTESETIYVTVGSATASVLPIQSSAAAYYPTSGYPSASGVAGSSSGASTGFITISKSTAGASSYAPIATGGAKPTGYWF